ncbi:MAG: DOMON domain-containing protein [Myxococcota bacterium]
MDRLRQQCWRMCGVYTAVAMQACTLGAGGDEAMANPTLRGDAGSASHNAAVVPVSARAIQIERRGMRAGWDRQGDRLDVSLEAPTQGWVLIGFNTEQGLQGARLVFVHVRPQHHAQGEVHRTDLKRYPAPYHKPRTAIGGTNAITAVRGVEDTKGTRVSFSVPLDSGEPDDVVLRPGASMHVILAWSQSDDTNHHSAMRTAVDMVVVPDVTSAP